MTIEEVKSLPVGSLLQEDHDEESAAFALIVAFRPRLRLRIYTDESNHSTPSLSREYSAYINTINWGRCKRIA